MSRAVAILTLGLCLSVGSSVSAAPNGPLPPGTLAPEIKGTTLDGQTLKLSALRGKKTVMVAFLSRFCELSREGLTDFQKLHAQLSPQKSFTFIGVGVDKDVEDTKHYVRQYKVKFPVVQDSGHKVVKAYGAQVTPTVFLVGKSGRVLRWYTGSREKIGAAVRADAKTATAGNKLPSSKPIRGMGCAIVSH